MKQLYVKTLIFTFTILVLAVEAQTKMIPYQQLVDWNGNATGSNMFFGALMTNSNFTVTFVGPSDRWIALGLGTQMYPGDVLVYTSGNPGGQHALTWKDYNNSVSGSTIDASQDWTIISTTSALGQRTVVASRVLNTGDPYDIPVSFSSPSLNIIWARNATADYTMAYHGSTNRAYNISLPWLSTPVASFSVATTTVCAGSSLTFSNTTTGGLTSYTWSFAGGNIATSSATNPIVTYTSAGLYSVALTASNAVGTNSVSQINYITVTPSVVPSISITQASGANPICSGALATFTANPTNSGPAPVFQWKVNGGNAGTNSPTFSSTSLPSPAVITCIMTANSVCAVPNTATSSAITLTVNSSAPASVSVAVTGGGNPMCSGSTATFTATPGNGGSSPAYQWKINNVNAGSNSPTFITSALTNGNVVNCEITSSSTCAVTATASSSGITMTVSNVLVPSVAVNISAGSNPLCAGAPVTFTALPGNGGTTPSYQWKVNGGNAGSNSSAFTSSVLSNGAVVTCVMTSNSPCSSPPTATSSAIALTVNPIPPAPVISPAGNTTLCSGAILTLSSSATTGNNWSTGANTQTIAVSSAGAYSVSQTVNGCTSPHSATTSVSVIPSPTAALVPVTDLCADDAPVQLQGSPGGGAYSGAAIFGNQFDPSIAGPGTFAVVYSYVASNSCGDTAAISIIVSECTGIKAAGRNISSISVYPNPARGSFIISSDDSHIMRVRVTDACNRIIADEKTAGTSKAYINLGEKSQGIYFIEAELEKHTIIRTRIVSIE